MSHSSLDATLERARSQYQALRYEGPGLRVERPAPAAPRLGLRLGLATALVVAVAALAVLRSPDPELAPGTQASMPTPYDALSAARRQLAARPPARPDRPPVDLFAMPAAPDRSTGFDRTPDLG